jgi:cobalamin biosynthesis Mg chelatase CobN
VTTKRAEPKSAASASSAAEAKKADEEEEEREAAEEVEEEVEESEAKEEADMTLSRAEAQCVIAPDRGSTKQSKGEAPSGKETAKLLPLFLLLLLLLLLLVFLDHSATHQRAKASV